MSLTILLEIGHDASLREKIASDGFTHDWEVFIRGRNGADIQYYVDRVVFHLHHTFPNPKRVVKEAPFSLKASGYAGFKLLIDIYLKNNQEPKKIKFNYDLDLQPSGPPIHHIQKEKYTFFNPSEEFRNKLLKGGAVEGSGNQENSVNRVGSEDKIQMTSKPKLSGSDITKKHKMKFDEPRTTDFENLFGTPIKKNSKLPEQTKPRDSTLVPKPPNQEKFPDKDKSDKSKSNKSVHKDKDKDKPKEKSSDSSDKRNKEEKRKSKDDKGKDRERTKEKSSKKDKEREKSPTSRPRSPSPKRSPKRESSPPQVQKHSSSKEKESSKDEKRDKDRDKDKKEDKKSKKDRRDHKEGKHKERDKDKEHREHKSKDRDSRSSRDKESSSSSLKVKESSPMSAVSVSSSQTTQKTDKKPKDKEHVKEQTKDEERVEKVEKSEKSERPRQDSDDRQSRHKHKKKDRKEKKEDKHSKKEDRKSEKQPSSTSSVKEVRESISATITRDIDKSNLFGSPKSDSPPTPKEPETKIDNSNLFSREDESSNDSVKLISREASPIHHVPSRSPSPVPVQEPIRKIEPEKKRDLSPKKKDKKERKKDKKVDKDHEKRKKRKSDPSTTTDVEPSEKKLKVKDDSLDSDEETKVKVPDVEMEDENRRLVKDESMSDDESKVSSTEDSVGIMQPKSEFDMEMLRDLQQKIIGLKDNANLQRVVQLIAETGKFEISAHTFDFDLCLLDTSTIEQLQNYLSTLS